MVNSKDKPKNHPIYDVDIDLGSYIFFNDVHIEPNFPIVIELKEDEEFAKRQEGLE